MPTARDRFISGQAAVLDAYFGLADNENEARSRFEALALDTYDCIAGKVRVVGPFVPYPSASNFADYDRGAGNAAPPDIRRRWQDWKSEYRLLLQRQPVLELRDALHKISESHNSSSWPYGLEERIRDWIDSGDRKAVPFDDLSRVATDEVYDRLRELRQKVDGWLYWDSEKKRVMFAGSSSRPSAKA